MRKYFADTEKKEVLSRSELLSVIFRYNAANFAGLATQVHTTYVWEDMEIAEAQKKRLITACDRYRLRDRIDEKYGVATKEVNFDNESFRALCDYVKENVNDKSYDPNESNGNGSCYNFAEFLLTNGNNVSEKTVLGYPSPDGRGPVISVVTSIGISAEASSAVADGAWEFIKYCLSGEVQEMIARYDENPMSIDAFDTTAKKVLENYNSNSFNRFTGTKNEPQDEGVIATYKNFLLSASVTDNIDPAILIVLREELPPYFLDQKSFDDVLKIIQDRVSTIIAERK